MADLTKRVFSLGIPRLCADLIVDRQSLALIHQRISRIEEDFVTLQYIIKYILMVIDTVLSPPGRAPRRLHRPPARIGIRRVGTVLSIARMFGQPPGS